ncbi:MAG: DTW domain-containing protein [Planctomycetota bacterium]|nr:DTW domain-containing protein [Planctomycetota bacterium]
MKKMESEQNFPGRGRSRSRNRCKQCALSIHLCLCNQFELRTIRTKIVLLTHQKELWKTTNSGRLLQLILNDVDLRVRGKRGHALDLADLVDHHGPKLILYPSTDSVPLTPDLIGSEESALLVVPDGTWRQARKVVSRVGALADFQRVHLKSGAPSRYRLRKSEDPSRLCTYEAVARALGVLESVELQREMESLLDLMVERFLWTRGRLRAKDVQGGIPKAALEEHRRKSMRGQKEESDRASF